MPRAPAKAAALVRESSCYSSAFHMSQRGRARGDTPRGALPREVGIASARIDTINKIHTRAAHCELPARALLPCLCSHVMVIRVPAMGDIRGITCDAREAIYARHMSVELRRAQALSGALSAWHARAVLLLFAASVATYARRGISTTSRHGALARSL